MNRIIFLVLLAMSISSTASEDADSFDETKWIMNNLDESDGINQLEGSLIALAVYKLNRPGCGSLSRITESQEYWVVETKEGASASKGEDIKISKTTGSVFWGKADFTLFYLRAQSYE